MKIKTYKFKDDNVNVKVPFDGETYVNATEVYKAFGKSQTSFSHWKTRTLVPYAEKLIELKKIVPCQSGIAPDNQKVTIDDLIIVRVGNQHLEQGTWVHPKLAIVFARWLSMEFEIWCDEKITQLLSTGAVELGKEDQKYLELKEKVFSHTDPSDKYFIRYVRQLLQVHESEGHNMRAFENFMTELSKYTNKTSKLEAYVKVSKVIEELYQAGEMDITTREKMKKLCQTCIDRIRSRRLTIAEAKVKELETTKGLNVDKTTHDELVSMTMDLTKAKEEVESLGMQTAGIVAKAVDEGLYLFNFSSDYAGPKEISEINSAVDSKGYRKLFHTTLLPKTPIPGKKIPACANDQPIAGYGTLSAAVWEHENSSFVRVTSYDNYGRPGTVAQMSMFPIGSSENHRGVNDHKTICAVYNKSSKYLIVYGLPAVK